MRARVVVADQSEARFNDLEGVRGGMRLVHQSEAAIIAHVPWDELA